MEVKQIIVVRTDLDMPVGKLASQVAHASLAPILEKMRSKPHQEIESFEGDYTLSLDLEEGQDLKYWLDNDFKKIILKVKSGHKLINLYNKLREDGIIASLIYDNGLTIFNGAKTLTCMGIEPLESSKIDKYTKRLQIL
jgi:PTH2 family peptidyl-tRNA hydrolase